MSMKDVLGPEVVDSGKKPVQSDSFAKPNKVVGLYFSAHWCPPCREFTPVLVNWYKKLKESDKKDEVEIIFISSDKDAEQFDEYFSEMPWHALPYGERDRKADIQQRFNVRGIPALIFLDGLTGELVNKDGRMEVSNDPNGLNFPYRMQPLEELLAGTFKSQTADVSGATALRGKIKGLYFSAHWCPPCRAFTPKLIETYNKLKAAKRNFEVIFVSSDRSPENFDEYYGTMPWLALPYGDARKRSLSAYFEVEGIPTLVILDEKNQLITDKGRESVSADPNGQEFPWHPKPLVMITDDTIDVVNEMACFLLLTGGEAAGATLVPDLTTLAYKYWDDCNKGMGGNKLQFLYEGEGVDSQEVIDTLKRFAKLPDALPLAVIIDIPKQQKCLVEGLVTIAKITEMVTSYKTGNIVMTQISLA